MMIEVVLVVVLSAATGAVVAHAVGPHPTGVLRLASLVLVVAALAVGALLQVSLLTCVTVPLLAVMYLTGGLLWKDNPLLEGAGYFERVWYAASTNRGRMREASRQREQDQMMA